jgi:MFS family permease
MSGGHVTLQLQRFWAILRDRLGPMEGVSDHDRIRGMRLVLIDGLTSQGMETLASGLLLTAFAVALGASNLTIGLLVAIPSLAHLMQIPGVILIERLRARRLLTVVAAGIGRASLVLLGAGMVLPPSAVLPLVIVVAIVNAVCGAIAGCCWNSWMRDLLPPQEVNRFFARRMMYGALLGAVLSFLASLLIARAGSDAMGGKIALFSAMAMTGGLIGLVGVVLVARTPEPQMVARSVPAPSITAILAEPFRSRNFRRLMVFMGTWLFSVNLAVPFFTVYMLKSLDLDLSSVTLLAIAGQLANVACVRLWARFADATSNKAALRLACQMIVVCLAGWVFIGHPSLAAWTVPLLCGLHIVMGAASAGVTLASGSIALKLSPPGQATAYLAMNSMISALAAGSAPIIGGAMADVLSTYELGITIHWATPVTDLAIPALQMRHWQFFFALASVSGFLSLFRLQLVREVGDVSRRVVSARLRRVARTAAVDVFKLGQRYHQRIYGRRGDARVSNATALPVSQ